MAGESAWWCGEKGPREVTGEGQECGGEGVGTSTEGMGRSHGSRHEESGGVGASEGKESRGT